jgi:hypothetical protein
MPWRMAANRRSVCGAARVTVGFQATEPDGGGELGVRRDARPSFSRGRPGIL